MLKKLETRMTELNTEELKLKQAIESTTNELRQMHERMAQVVGAFNELNQLIKQEQSNGKVDDKATKKDTK